MVEDFKIEQDITSVHRTVAMHGEAIDIPARDWPFQHQQIIGCRNKLVRVVERRRYP